MPEDKVEVEATPGGGKVAVSGPEATRVSKQIGDLISPFSELAGLAGDHLRIFRFESIIRRLNRAKEIAAERGEPIRPVHPKNLIPWIENASLEDEEDSELTDLWAELLLSGTEDFDSELAILTDCLKRIGSTDAIVLRDLCFASAQFPKAYPRAIDRYFNEKTLGTVLSVAAAQKSKIEVQEIIKKAEQDLTDIYMVLANIDCDVDSMEGMIVLNPRKDLAKVLKASSALEGTGLMTSNTIEVRVEERLAAALYFQVTTLGVRLIERCNPNYSRKGGAASAI